MAEAVKVCPTTRATCCGGGHCHHPRSGPRIVYFEDEELDQYAGREGCSYSAEEVAEFREVSRNTPR